MKTQLKMTLIASAVAALISGPAMAENNPDKVQKKVKVDIDIDRNETNHVDNVLRDLVINASAGASANDRQVIQSNGVSNKKLTNNASVGDNVGNGASGNIGMNVAAGDTNVQDNAAALAAVDAGFVFGESTASVNVHQANMGNVTMNSGVMNNASIGQSAFANASGNIGVNVAAGTGNGQKNTMAASVSTARVASASLNSNQESYGNSIRNEGRTEKYTEMTNVTFSGTGSYSGGSESFSADITGSMDQTGDVYPDTWTNDIADIGSPHGEGTVPVGHFDLDGQTEGGSDLNDDGGALAFGAHEMEANGGFSESGTLDLSEVSGQVATTRYVVVNARNDASLAGSAFANASGNIGVNVASGTGNLQSNSLSMAVACNTCAGGGSTGGESN